MTTRGRRGAEALRVRGMILCTRQATAHACPEDFYYYYID